MPITSEKDLQNLKNRILELADKSYNRSIYTYTPFLGLSEQQVFYEVEKEVSYAGCDMYGGSSICERKIVRFGNSDTFGYDEEYPIARIEMAPAALKFAEKLTHRDFLGAVMNLGIERGLVGDIILNKSGAVLFCNENIASYITENLNKVRHTNIKCSVLENVSELEAAKPDTVALTVSSPRIDGIISKLYNISRSESRSLFNEGKIFVNGRLTENVGYQLKKDDAVTVRGYGKFIYYGQTGVSKKGKDRIEAGVYGR